MLLKKIICFVVVLCFMGLHVGAKEKGYKRIALPAIYCIGIDSNTYIRNVPEKTSSLKSANATNIKFEVNFDGVSIPAQNAIEYAFQQWGNYLSSPIAVRVNVGTGNLGTNVLASAAPTGFYYDFEGALPNLLYPVSLMEKITKTNINGEAYDIDITITNDESKWYYGIDGNAPDGKYDLVSTVMHELGHGLGFIGSMRLDEDDLGFWGFYNGRATIFDKFIQNGSGLFLLNQSLFPNPSAALKTQLTGNSVYFASQISILNNPYSGFPRLYAPSTFASGSSIYHLNESTYPVGNENALMTHVTGTAESNHVPGPLTINMFQEMGWSYVYIDHEEQNDIDDNTYPVKITAKITGDNLPAISKNYLKYRVNGGSLFDSISMLIDGADEIFSALIDLNQSDSLIDYYITSEDEYGRVFSKPFNAPGSLYSFKIGSDAVQPWISHIPLDFVIIGTDSVKIEVKAFDNLGVDTVWVDFKINFEEPVYSFGLTNDSLNIYSGYFDLSSLDLAVNDSIEYDIIVVDASKNSNKSIFHTGSMVFSIEGIPDVIDEYVQDFDIYASDFWGVKKAVQETGDLNFYISRPIGFYNGCLHTPNPYISSNENNDPFEYIAQLRYPIRLDNKAAIRYDEIVLVEPGDEGYDFGSDRFWDYVILEVSKDSGKTWLYLEPGYDSRKNNSWESTFYSRLDIRENSTALGSASLYITNHINLLENKNLHEGDTLFFRFRLYSDATVYGWGWAIDNLNIQGPVGIEPLTFDNAMINVYPNPVDDRLNVEFQFERPIENLNLRLIDAYGRMVKYKNLGEIGKSLDETIDMSDLPKGLYILVMESDKDTRSRKIIKR